MVLLHQLVTCACSGDENCHSKEALFLQCRDVQLQLDEEI